MLSVTRFVLGMTSPTKFSSSTCEVISREAFHAEWWKIDKLERRGRHRTRKIPAYPTTQLHQSKSGRNIVVTAHTDRPHPAVPKDSRTCGCEFRSLSQIYGSFSILSFWPTILTGKTQIVFFIVHHASESVNILTCQGNG